MNLENFGPESIFILHDSAPETVHKTDTTTTFKK
jgi:hypothetical protein